MEILACIVSLQSLKRLLRLLLSKQLVLMLVQSDIEIECMVSVIESNADISVFALVVFNFKGEVSTGINSSLHICIISNGALRKDFVVIGEQHDHREIALSDNLHFTSPC